MTVAGGTACGPAGDGELEGDPLLGGGDLGETQPFEMAQERSCSLPTPGFLALSIMAEARTALGAYPVDTAWIAGQTLTVEQAIGEALDQLSSSDPAELLGENRQCSAGERIG
jgi:hypothetical protein